MKTQTNNSLLTVKANVFFEKDIIVHVTTHSGSWYNGMISEICNIYIKLKTIPYGSEKIIFFSEIKSIDSYQPK